MNSISSSSSTLASPQPPSPGGESGRADAGAAWSAFASAATAADFCSSWLALQCLQIEAVQAALLLLEQGGGTFVPAAVWPSAQTDVGYLAPAAEQCLGERQGKVLRGQPGALVVVAYPVELEGRLHGAVIVDLAERPDDALQHVLRQLHWGIGWIETLFLRRQSLADTERVERARSALDVLAVAAEHERLPDLALAVVNDLASRFA